MHKYVVDSCEPISSTAQLITLKTRDGTTPLVFRPGQYAAISFYRKNRPTPARCFSLVSSPTDTSTLQFSMRTNGKFTRAASSLSAGDEVNVRGPFGAFVLDVDESEAAVLLAGGIGITPFMSMVRYASRLELNKEITLIYSCRNQDDAPFADELLRLSERNPLLKVIFAIAEGSHDRLLGATVRSGRITDQLLSEILTPDNYTKYYICGPPAFMKGMDKLLRDRDVEVGNIMTEAFSQGPNRQTGKIKSWPYNIYTLGSLSLVLGSFIIMATDLVKTLPPSTYLKEIFRDDEGINSRSEDIDKTINSLPASPSTAPASASTQSASTSTASSSSTQSSTPASTTTSTPAPVTTRPTRTAPACVSTPSAPC